MGIAGKQNVVGHRAFSKETYGYCRKKKVCKYKGNITHSLLINDIITSGSNKQKYPSETSSETA